MPVAVDFMQIGRDIIPIEKELIIGISSVIPVGSNLVKRLKLLILKKRI